MFALMRRLREKGVSVVFISHRLEEVLAVVDRIIVMRDGQRVGTMTRAEATETKIIQMMVGREVGLFPKEDAPIGETVLEVRNLSGEQRRERRQLHHPARVRSSAWPGWWAPAAPR